MEIKNLLIGFTEDAEWEVEIYNNKLSIICNPDSNNLQELVLDKDNALRLAKAIIRNLEQESNER